MVKDGLDEVALFQGEQVVVIPVVMQISSQLAYQIIEEIGIKLLGGFRRVIFFELFPNFPK